MHSLDHAVVGGTDHDALVERFAEAGLAPEFGGVHDHGTTRMSVLGFDDGSYLELIGPTAGTPPEEAVFWPEHLAADAGPTTWASLVPDVADEVVRYVRAGEAVDGPHEGARERPDGTLVEWDMAFVGDDSAGEALPFPVADRTPRRYRTTPTDSVVGGPLAGVSQVVLAVPDADAWAGRLARLYRTASPVPFDHPTLAADLFDIPGTPVVLAEPPSRDPGDLRGEGLPAGPAAFLLGTTDLDTASERYDLSPAEEWHGRRFAWVDGLAGQVGVVEPPRGGSVSAGPHAG